MSQFTIVPLSGSTDFRGILVTPTALGSAETIHTAQASASLPDLVSIEAFNSDTVARPLKLAWGGTTDPDDVLAFVLLPGETRMIVHQRPIRNSLIIKAASVTMTWVDGRSYTGSADKIVITGGSYVQRQTS